MKEYEIKSMATLGSSLSDNTCCMVVVVSRFGMKVAIIPYRNFELAAEAVLKGHVDAMVVPAAYPHLSSFIMNKFLFVAFNFLDVIPDLVFASNEPKQREKYTTLFNHPATNFLAHENDMGIQWENHENVNSNSVACQRVLENGAGFCAITNAITAQKHGLHIHQVLRPHLQMPFHVFMKSAA